MIRTFRPAPIPCLALSALLAFSIPEAAPTSPTEAAPKSAPAAAPVTAPRTSPNPAHKNASKPAPPRDPLSGFRELASDLWTQGPGPDTGLVLEYQLNRRANLCTGHEPEVRLRLSADGRLEMLRTRSFAESDRAGPGGFSGRIGKKAWDSVFAQVSGMEWETSLPGLPMPGMSESNQVIELRRSGRTARFEFTGAVPVGHDRIADGLAAVTGMLRAAAADTLWSLNLAAEAGKYKQGALRVRASWSLRGKSPLRLRMPLEGGETGCGSIGLRWTLLPKDVQGFTAVPSERNWTYPKSGMKTDRRGKGETIGPGTWQELQPGDSISVSADFPATKAKNSSRVEREGSLMHSGIAVALAGSEDTLAVVTLFSGYFRF